MYLAIHEALPYIDSRELTMNVLVIKVYFEKKIYNVTRSQTLSFQDLSLTVRFLLQNNLDARAPSISVSSDRILH